MRSIFSGINADSRALAPARGGTGFGALGFEVAVFGGRGGVEGFEEAVRGRGDLLNGCEEGGVVHFRRLVEAADLADILKRGRADFLIGRRRLEVE